MNEKAEWRPLSEWLEGVNNTADDELFPIYESIAVQWPDGRKEESTTVRYVSRGELLADVIDDAT